MKPFVISVHPIDAAALTAGLDDACAGACVVFEGRVRNHNGGRAVVGLDYQAHAALAEAEGERLLAEAIDRFGLRQAHCVHRVGALGIGEPAVWVGVGADHRGAAFEGCRWIIDELKRRVPIWKNEHYADGESGWLHPDPTPSPPHP
jgi:molybdopterin synthase catalytic subunit